MGRYKKERILKTSEMTKITSIEDLDVNIYQHDVTPNTVTFDGKFTSVQLGGLTIVYQCPKWYSKVDIKDEIAICDHCSIVSAEDQCSSKCEIGCTLINTDTKVKYNVVVPHKKLWSCACLAWRKDCVCKAPIKRCLHFWNKLSKQCNSYFLECYKMTLSSNGP